MAAIMGFTIIEYKKPITGNPRAASTHLSPLSAIQYMKMGVAAIDSMMLERAAIKAVSPRVSFVRPFIRCTENTI